MGQYKDKVYKYWIYKFMSKGRTYGGRGFETRREATAAETLRREELKKEQQIVEKSTKTPTDFSIVATAYLDIAKRRFVDDVFKRKVNVFRAFLAAVNDMPIEKISPLHIQNYLKTLEGNSLYNENRHELSALFNWSKKTYTEPIPNFVNPCLGVGSMPYESEEKNPPSEDEVARIIEAARNGDERDIILTCLFTLGRIDEVFRLRWKEDIHFDSRFVMLWTRKRRNGQLEPDSIPMNDDLYDVLQSRWEHRKQDKWVFYNESTKDRYYHLHTLMPSVCARAGIDPIRVSKQRIGRGKKKGQFKDVNIYYGFHSLRHFMATYLMEKEGVTLKTVSGLLRHKNVRTTEIYLHPIDQTKIDATAKIQGKFTPKNQISPQTVATKPNKPQKKGLDIRSNP